MLVQVETAQMFAVETGQMFAVETRQMSSVARTDICPVSTEDIHPVSAADFWADLGPTFGPSSSYTCLAPSSHICRMIAPMWDDIIPLWVIILH